jgi:urea carboxylase-associated protein 2
MSAFTHEVPGGAAWSLVLRRHQRLTLSALDDDANVSMLIYSAEDRLERLNVPDTLKAQMSACVRAPLVLMSDMGRALCSVTGSSLPWHDAITGHSLDRDLVRFGKSDYAIDRNAWRRSARSGLLDELWKHGLDRRDLHATVNWFTKVVPGDDERGTLSYVPGHAGSGDWVELRAEQDVLIVFSTSPHPMNPDPIWQPSGVRASTAESEAPAADDPARVYRDESARALAMSERSAA